MTCMTIAAINHFQTPLKKFSNNQVFLAKLQALEIRLYKVKIFKINSPFTFKECIRTISGFLIKMFFEKYHVYDNHLCLHFKKLLNHAKSIQDKKEVIKNQIQHIKNYLKSMKKASSDEKEHTDILYIYWHSKSELRAIKEINDTLKCLDKEILKLEYESQASI